MGYHSEWTKCHLPTRRERNAFYTAVGYRVPPGQTGLDLLRKLDPMLPPAGILAGL
jgi:hypothetical protein